MDQVLERPGALDVHKEQVTACVRTPGKGGKREQLVREFKTTVRGLLALRDWLSGLGVTTVAMEATGVYWRPIWHVLEDDFELLLCNAAHVKNVPGRKTDVSDAAWLAAVDDAPDDDELVALVQELESLCEMADGLPPDDPIVNDVVQRADRVLALTRQSDGPLAMHARFTACCERARFLARRGDAVDALPSAREAAEMASRGRGAEPGSTAECRV